MKLGASISQGNLQAVLCSTWFANHQATAYVPWFNQMIVIGSNWKPQIAVRTAEIGRHGDGSQS